MKNLTELRNQLQVANMNFIAAIEALRDLREVRLAWELG